MTCMDIMTLLLPVIYLKVMTQSNTLGPSTPIFFILSPGVNPLKDVEALGKKLGYSTMNKNFHNVSLGQGQETVAEDAMAPAARGKVLN